MGIWDYIAGTTDSLKRKSFGPRWPTPDSVKRITPDVTSAKNLCSTAYGYGAGAVTQIDKAVRGNLNYYLGDTEGRAKIVRFSSSIVKHTAHESLKTVPGYKILSKSLRDVKESDNQTSQKESDKEKVHLKAVRVDLDGLKKEFSENRKLPKQEEIDKPCADLKSADKIRSKM
ncbi:uncharacterized protein [Pyrus communis]|uniref:uncharacterized protein n=1 Tax=Pyrus communis TaxID=23211 RepID=UPI0035C048BA